MAILFAFTVLGIGAAVGGGVDLARLSASGSKLQNAADAAALSVATAVAKAPLTTATGTLQSAALASAKEFAAPAFQQTQSSHAGATAVEIQSRTPGQAKVTLSQQQDTMFGALLGVRSWPLHRSAVAVSKAAYPVCMLVLDPNASDAWSVQGSSEVVGLQCVAQVNSKSAHGLNSNGGAAVKMLRTFVAGPQQTASGFSPVPYFDQAPLEDPLAARFNWLAPATCQTLAQVKKETKVLAPGAYCGGFDLATGAVLRLQAGVYVLKTGSVELQSGAVLDGSAGVALVLLDPNGTVSVKSGATLTLSSAKTGDWANVALAIKPQPTERTSELSGGGELDLDGIVYAPTQYLRLTGGGTIQRADAPRIFVVRRIATQGNGSIFLRGSSALVMGNNTRLVK